MSEGIPLAVFEQHLFSHLLSSLASDAIDLCNTQYSLDPFDIQELEDLLVNILTAASQLSRNLELWYPLLGHNEGTHPLATARHAYTPQLLARARHQLHLKVVDFADEHDMQLGFLLQ
jgi:hypothetical protein